MLELKQLSEIYKMQNDVPNSSIPPSSMPPNSPQPNKSNAGLIVAIVIIVFVFIINFLLPMFAFFFIAANLEDFVKDFDWSYDTEIDGSDNYIGFWLDDATDSYLGLSGDSEYIWINNPQITDESQVESGKYTVAHAHGALENQDITIDRAKTIFGFASEDESFDIYRLYSINLLDESATTETTPVIKRSLLVYHRTNTTMMAYEKATDKSYAFEWQSPYTTVLDGILNEGIEEDGQDQPAEATETSQI